MLICKDFPLFQVFPYKKTIFLEFLDYISSTDTFLLRRIE